MVKFIKKILVISFLCFSTIIIYKEVIKSIYSIENIMNDYSLELARKSGCVIFSNGDIISGQESWDEFVSKVNSGKKAKIRLVDFLDINEENASDYGYNEIDVGEGPEISVMDLLYNGVIFELTINEENCTCKSEFRYLMRYEGTYNYSDESYLKYVLTNDNTVTWDEIWDSILSSNKENKIDFFEIYYNDLTHNG